MTRHDGTTPPPASPDDRPAEGFIVGLAQAVGELPLPPTAQWPEGVFDRDFFTRPELTVAIFAPVGEDHQQPHDRDELYVVARGTATFELAGARRRVASGDLIYVPARVEHRFHDMAGGFATWVVFFGPPHD